MSDDSYVPFQFTPSPFPWGYDPQQYIHQIGMQRKQMMLAKLLSDSGVNVPVDTPQQMSQGPQQ